MSDKSHIRHVHMGLGSAIRRFMDIEWRLRMTGSGVSDDLRTERTMLLTALDAVPLNLGFDCNSDGVPDTVEIFRQSAVTSCCRIIPGQGGPVVTATIREDGPPVINTPEIDLTTTRLPAVRRGGSRRKKRSSPKED